MTCAEAAAAPAAIATARAMDARRWNLLLMMKGSLGFETGAGMAAAATNTSAVPVRIHCMPGNAAFQARYDQRMFPPLPTHDARTSHRCLEARARWP
jgi:hypothetical protein